MSERSRALGVRFDRWLSSRGGIATFTTAIAFVILAVVVVFGIRGENDANDAREEIRVLSERNNEILMQLEDCLTPGGECAQRSAQRQADVIRQLQEVDIFLIACARENPAPAGPDVIIECVERHIGRELPVELAPPPTG